mgnify:CR=1 FL=1
MKSLFLLTLLVLPFFSNVTSQHTDENWVLKRDKGGIKVYVRENPDSKIKELKFTTKVEASLNTITSVLTHIEGYDKWVYASVISRPIKIISDREAYYYTEVDFPWPFDNRDLVLHSKVWQDPKTLTIHTLTTSAHWMEAEKEGLVRIKKADLRWTFTPLGNGVVKVDYYMNTDPGGKIPAWMVNLAADQGPLQTMIKFKEMLTEEQYKNSKLAFVKEMK